MSPSIPWGGEELAFELPSGWNLLGYVKPAEVKPTESVEDELRSALQKPFGIPPLKRLCEGKNKIAVVVEDISRPTPANLFMKSLLDEMLRWGAQKEAITLVTGTGTHRAMTEAEMEEKVGKEVAQEFRWVNHDCRDKSSMVSLGKTKRGTPVELNKLVVEADLVVLVGTIEPHPHAGFGGGFKNIVPGVASDKTIGYNHLLSATKRNYSMVGWEPEKNPMRLDAEEVGRMLKGQTFMVNTVLTPDLKISRIFAGDPIQAHRAGLSYSRSIYGVEIERQADVVISSSHPMDHDLRQGVKAVANTFAAAKERGLVIAAMRCKSGAGDMEVPKISIPKSEKAIRLMEMALVPVVRYLPFGIPIEERFYMYTALRTVLRNRVVIYAPEIPLEARKKLSYFFSTQTFQETLETAAERIPKADVLIFPKGGITYPIIKE